MNLPASPQTYNELKSSLTRFIGSQATVALNRDGQSGLFIDPPGFSLADISKLEQAIGGPDLKSFLPGADTPAIALDFSRITLESLALIAGEDDQATQLTFTIAWDPGLTKSFKGPMAGARQKTQSDFALKEISVTFEMINHSYSAVLEARLVVEQVTLDVKVSLPGLIFEAQLLQFATLDDDGNIVAGSIEPIPKGDKLANRYLPASLVKMKQSPLKLQELRILIALRQERFIFFMVVDNLLSLEPFTLKRLQVEVVYAGSVSSELDVQLYGVVEIDLGPNALPIIIGLGGEYSTSGGVKFYGRIGSQGIQVKEVIDAVAKSLQLSPPELPQILAGAKIVQLGFEYTSKPKKFTFSFAATFQFSKEEPPVDLRLNYFGDAGSMLLSGAVTIEGEEFDLAFERKKVPAGQQSAAPAQKETYMLGAFVSKDNAAVDLAGLVQNVSPQVAQAVPKVNLSIKDILFAYAQPANGRSTFLFALAVNLDLDLTQIQVVGDELKAYHPLGLSEIQAIYATDMLSAGSAAAFNDIFSKNQINVSLPLPAQDAAAISPTPAAPAPGSPGQVPPPVALNAGFNFGATLDLPAGKYPLLSGARNPAPPRPGDQSPVPAQTPPAAGSQASKLTPPSQSAALAAASNATWIEVQTQVGPVLIQRLGGRYANERIWLLLSGSLAVGPMTLDLQGMGVGFKLSAPPAPEFTLDGMGLAYSSGPLQITGIFL
ncbi:MAG: DUF6603 domain-containing protein, partial [Candidatus Promineifilaceae bacterium]|nr:DUF6603 domain-containing protein [Candidatus Promineifilaceae bacterium]